MKKEIAYKALAFYMANSNRFMVEQLLKNFVTREKCLDVVQYIRIAIAHENALLVKLLLDYMLNTKQIEANPRDNSTTQAIKFTELQGVLNEAVRDYSPSDEIISVLSCFIDKSDSDNLSVRKHSSNLSGLMAILDTKQFDSRGLNEILDREKKF
jgi:hypothetical protein